MKISTSLSLALLGLCVQLSSQASISQRTNTTATSAYIQIEDSSNKTLDGYWGYVDPNYGGGNGVAFQFTSDKSKATNFSIIEDSYLAGYKTGYIAGSTNAEGTPSGDVIFMSPQDLLIQGGEPTVTAQVNVTTGVVNLSDTLGSGLKRNLPQACFVSLSGTGDSSLRTLVLGEEYFSSNSCANVTLYWRPIGN
ncbi:hypothetical protein DTO169E5_2951 [Paecilomyces variotii]|nr:hypothetical protein DTO169E5_2951 [Paecilomyces variotii]KAJ9391455.1 hypothetical protein DTO063F5_1065 [Paecilomyces variotii]